MADKMRTTFFAGTFAVYAAAFWGQQGFLELCERFKLFQRYKIQESKRADPALVRSAYRDVLASHAISVPLSLWFLGSFFKKRGMQFSLKKLPSFSQMLATLCLWHALFDTWFYWAHRLFHTKWLYKRFHKQHHRFTTPVGIAAVYAHPVEDIVVNIGSTFVGPLVFPSHFIVWLLYMGMRFHETIDSHSGYDFPWSPWRALGKLHGGARRHDWHHSHQVGNFGGFWFWDWLCGTEGSSWKQSDKRVEKTMA